MTGLLYCAMAAVWRCASRTTGPSSYPIMAPDSHGKFENVVIGFDTLEEALAGKSKDYYIGATIGPVAGRILHGALRVGEKKIITA